MITLRCRKDNNDILFKSDYFIYHSVFLLYSFVVLYDLGLLHIYFNLHKVTTRS